MTALGACTTGAPPGFSDGDQWVIPLVGPLEDGLLLVPTFVNDQGPFLFAIDPDAYISIIDEDVLHTTKVPAGEGPRLLDESDTQQTRQYAEVSSLKVGTLTVNGQRYVQLVRKGTFDADGRRIHGVLGRDVIADSLVFGFDRDLGVATLSTQKAFKKPVGATSLSYTKLVSTVLNAEVVPLPRRLVHATIGGMEYPLHVDFGATYSQLRPRAWPRAKLAASETKTGVVDEVGVIRSVNQMGVADAVTLRDATTKGVSFVPYADKRWPDQDIEGTLGLGFFRPYSVLANWDTDTLYLTPRKDGTSTKLVARIGRWQSKTLSSCADVGCVKASVVDPLAGKPADQMPAQHPGVVVSFVRDPSAKGLALEALVAVTPAPGKPQLKWLVVSLPAGAERAMTHLSGDYAGATLTVIDASPFPRSCPSDGGCVDQLTPPTDIDPNAPQMVSGLTRISGEELQNDDGSHFGVVGVAELTLKVKICVNEAGHVASAEVVKSSDRPKYDEYVVKTVKTWAFQPYVVAGKPRPACMNASFMAHIQDNPGIRDGL